MTYDLLLVGNLDLDRLRSAVAALAAVPGDHVDVAAADAGERNWGAAALCTYEPVIGDVNWSLDLYLAQSHPPDFDVASRLAAELGVLVLYSAQSAPPGAYWLVEPDGSRTRARVEDYDQGDATALAIEAVERPVVMLPRTKVELQPEVIREHHMDTPVADGFQALASDRKLLPGDPLWSAGNRLMAWEGLAVRMTFGWPPDGWYPFEYWQEDLMVRDTLAGDADRIPPNLVEAFTAALSDIDATFRAGTREISGVSADKAWWWHRLPEPPPWLNSPSATPR